jgi:hypothetical protein
MEEILIISSLVGIITLIVFFDMAYKIGTIRDTLKMLDAKISDNNKIDWRSAYNQGERKEYLGKKDVALECYMDAYFLLHHFIILNPDDEDEDYRSNKKLIEEKIKSLGGTVKEL